jgi:hypothetical protein
MRTSRRWRSRVAMNIAAVATVVSVVVAGAIPAFATQTPLLTGVTFASATQPGPWALTQAETGTNGTCLTAGAVLAQTPIPACSTSPTDAPGHGALRLTSNVGGKVGALFYNGSFPTANGLDITFNTYQYDTTGVAADGIGFAFTVTNPAGGGPPAQTGPVGGALGYAYDDGTGANGLTNGYLGFGLDVYGNYTSKRLRRRRLQQRPR